MKKTKDVEEEDKYLIFTYSIITKHLFFNKINLNK